MYASEHDMQAAGVRLVVEKLPSSLTDGSAKQKRAYINAGVELRRNQPLRSPGDRVDPICRTA
jgi:hypothetical protein